jgi:hypothetical protein
VADTANPEAAFKSTAVSRCQEPVSKVQVSKSQVPHWSELPQVLAPQTQPPALQISFEAQVFPQLPQFDLSLLVLAQWPPQQVLLWHWMSLVHADPAPLANLLAQLAVLVLQY